MRIERTKLSLILYSVVLALIIVPSVYTIIAYFFENLYNDYLYSILNDCIHIGIILGVVLTLWNQIKTDKKQGSK